MTLTISQFRATGRDVADLGTVISDLQLDGEAGRVYLECLYIKRWEDGRHGIAPANGPTWLVATDGPDETAGELSDLEARLYLWAMANGYGDYTPPASPRTYATEFPDFLPADVPAVLQGEGWKDYSWHNDACPFFVHEASGVGVWCFEADKAARDVSDSERFVATAMEWDADGEGLNGWSHDISGGGVLFVTDDAETLAASLPNFTNMRAIAHAFALAIETDCADDLARIRALNSTAAYATCCASHDFCDANMPMAEAFAAVMGRPFVTETGIADDDLSLVNAAWDIARADRLTASKDD